MEGRKIVLADETELLESECGYSDGILWCFLKDVDIMSAFRIFANKEKTRTIKFVFGESEITYENFTELTSVSLTYDGDVNVSLRKGEAENVPS